MIDYRKRFKKHYGLDFGREYVVHHIDMNRENNHIDNLMVLPRKLHSQYHNALWNLEVASSKDILNITGTMNIKEAFKIRGCQYTPLVIVCIEELIPIYSECRKWYDYKMYLDGKIPNVHKISLKITDTEKLGNGGKETE